MGSNPGTLRYEDHEHSILHNPNSNFDFRVNRIDRKGSQDMIYKESGMLRNSQSSNKNGTSPAIPNNVGTRSSFGSSSRSNSSSLGTNGTNKSNSSRGSLADTQN